jgi:hypothetical protein
MGMDLTLPLLALIGSWFICWAVYRFHTKKARSIVKGWQSQARVIQGRKIR